MVAARDSWWNHRRRRHRHCPRHLLCPVSLHLSSSWPSLSPSWLWPSPSLWCPGRHGSPCPDYKNLRSDDIRPIPIRSKQKEGGQKKDQSMSVVSCVTYVLDRSKSNRLFALSKKTYWGLSCVGSYVDFIDRVLEQTAYSTKRGARCWLYRGTHDWTPTKLPTQTRNDSLATYASINVKHVASNRNDSVKMPKLTDSSKAWQRRALSSRTDMKRTIRQRLIFQALRGNR